MLTNFETVRKSVSRLDHIDQMEKEGSFQFVTKKEALMLVKEREKLLKNLRGIRNMRRLPGALFVIDSKKEEIALKEAIKDLNSREKRILSMRFFQGKTQMEVASEIGISQAQVSRLEKAALDKIKKDI